MNELAQLRALAAKLRTTGKVKVNVDAGDVPGLSVARLTYETDGDVPIHWPITGAANFTFEYDEAVSAWKIDGNMFGVSPKATDPKTFFTAVYQGTRTRELTLRGFLQQAGQVAERYRGDLPHLCYRLGVETAAVGTMVQGPDFWQWTPSSDPGVIVYFFPDNSTPEPFTLQKAFIGFNPSPVLDHWELTQNNLLAIREQLKTYAHQAKEYCGDLSNCFT